MDSQGAVLDAACCQASKVPEHAFAIAPRVWPSQKKYPTLPTNGHALPRESSWEMHGGTDTHCALGCRGLKLAGGGSIAPNPEANGACTSKGLEARAVALPACTESVGAKQEVVKVAVL